MRGVTEKRGLQREVGSRGRPWDKGRLEVRFRTVFKAIQVDDICTRGSAVGWTCILFPGTVWLSPVRALLTRDPVWMEITSSLGAQCIFWQHTKGHDGRGRGHGRTPLLGDDPAGRRVHSCSPDDSLHCSPALGIGGVGCTRAG